MPSSTKKLSASEQMKLKWQDPAYREKVMKARNTPEAKEKRRKAQASPEYREKLRKATTKRWQNKAYRKRVAKAISKATNNSQELERRRKAALANPFFNGERNGELHTKDKWTEEHRRKASEHMAAYNKSKAGRKMASKRSKKTLSDPAKKQRMMDGKDAWYAEHPEVRVEHVKKYFQPHNDERHRQAEQRKSIKWWRDEYKNGKQPVVKPLPNQPQEYYDDLDEFFAEGV